MPLVIPESTDSAAGRSLYAYRQRLASRLGLYGEVETSELAASAAALKIAELADIDLQPTFYNGTWFRPRSGANAYQARRVKGGGFVPASGTFNLTRAFDAPTAAGVAVEFFGVLAPDRQLGQNGIRECVNLALAECWFLDSLSLLGVAGQTEYPLSEDYPWLDDADRIVDVWWRPSGSTRDELYPEWRFLADAELPRIEIRGSISPDDVLKPRVYRPLNTWIRSGDPAAWASSTVGLVADDDVALLSLETMEAVGLVHCYQTLAQAATGESQAKWEAKAGAQRVAANAAKAQLPRENGRDLHWGSARSSSMVGVRGDWPPLLG